MTLSLEDYMSPEKFPLTSKRRLSIKAQFRIDAFNFDSLIQYREEGNRLDERQVAILKELEVKIPAQKELREAGLNG